VYQYRDAYVGKTSRPDELELEDRWILSRLNSTIKTVRGEAGDLTAYNAARSLEDFALNDLSRGYVKMIRDRLRPGYDGNDRAAAEWTLSHVTNKLVELLAPFTPYIAEHLHDGDESIHLNELPEADDERIDAELEEYMELFQEIEESAAKLRQSQGVKLRHPVREVTVSGSQEVKKAVEMFEELIKDRLNTKQVSFEELDLNHEVKLDYANAGPRLGGDVKKVEAALAEADHDELAARLEAGDSVELAGHELESELFEVRTHVGEDRAGEEFSAGAVYIDTERDEELLDGAFVQEVIRAIQQARKEAELDVEDEVRLSFAGDVEPLREHGDELRNRVNLASIDYEGADLEYSGAVSFEGREVSFSFSEPR